MNDRIALMSMIIMGNQDLVGGGQGMSELSLHEKTHMQMIRDSVPCLECKHHTHE